MWWALCAGCASNPPRPDAREVQEITIEGNEKVSDSDIRSKILTSESDWWPFSERSYLDPNAWQADQRRIQRYYQARGYYQAEVLDSEVIEENEKNVRLRVTVREGQPARILKLDIHGLEPLTEAQRQAALRQLPLRPGDIFEEDAWTQLKDALAAFLRERGYAEVSLDARADVDVPRAEVNLSVTVTPGMRYKFGQVFVLSGPRPKVSAQRISEQAEGATPRGAWYSDSALAEAQARVFKMGVFGAVKVSRGTADPEQGTVPVVVDVRESPFHSIRMGGGAGLEQSRYEGRLLTEYVDRNFGGGLRKLTLRAKVGYAWLISAPLAGSAPTALEQSGVIFNATSELEQPRFLFRDITQENSLTVERSLEPAYNYIGTRLKVGFIWQPHPNFSIYPSYNFEAYSIHGVPTVTGTTPTEFLGCGNQGSTTSTSCFIPLSYLEQVIEWDRRDDRLEPRSGYYLALSFQQGGGPLMGASDFLRIVQDIRYYHTLPKTKLTLSARIRVGSLFHLSGDAPIVSRFFAGGGNSMRGFGSRRLSPLLLARPPEGSSDSPQTVPIGGDGLFETSVEGRYPVTNDLLVALFMDTGHVSVKRFAFSEIPKSNQYAVGFGIRYLTLLGPLRLDIAYLLPWGPPLTFSPALSGDDKQKYSVGGGCFGLGRGQRAGAPEGSCLIHLSIGEAF
jgi:translocation and assembly module TamA